MRQVKKKAIAHPGRGARASGLETSMRANPAPPLGVVSAPAPVGREELEGALEELREQMGALRRRLDEVVARPDPPASEGAAGAETPPQGTVTESEPPSGPRPGEGSSPVETGGPASAATAGAEETASAGPIRSRLRDLQVLAPGQSVPTRVLPAHEPFEMQLGLELGWMSGAVDRVLCQVSVDARRLGGGERWLVGQFTETLAPTTETRGIRLAGIPLPPGLYRFEARARLGRRGEAPANASTYLDGGLVTVG